MPPIYQPSRRLFLQHLITSLFALGSGLPHLAQNGRRFYISNLRGQDENTGRTADAPLKNLSALPTLQAGDTVFLERGSLWHDTLDVSANDVHIRAYGIGPNPIIDGTEAVPDPAFYMDTTVLVFEIETEVELDKAFVNLFYDGEFVPYVADLAQCRATPGTYTVSDHLDQRPLLYFHPLPGDDLTKLRYTKRNFGVNAQCRERIRIDGITTRRTLHHNGSTITGRSARLFNCRFEDGSKHNVYVQDGSTFENCSAVGAHFDGPLTLFVHFDETPQALGIRYIHCEATLDSFNERAAAYFGHSLPDTSATFGTVEVTGCKATNCGVAIQFRDAQQVTITDTIATNCRDGYRALFSGEHRIDGMTYIVNADIPSTRQFWAAVSTLIPDLNLAIQDLAVHISNIQSEEKRLLGIFVNHPQVNVDVTNSQFISEGGNFVAVQYGRDSSGSLSATRNTFAGVFNFVYNLNQASNLSDSNYNCFESDRYRVRLSDTERYTSIDDFRSRTPYDRLSTVNCFVER